MFPTVIVQQYSLDSWLFLPSYKRPQILASITFDLNLLWSSVRPALHNYVYTCNFGRSGSAITLYTICNCALILYPQQNLCSLSSLYVCSIVCSSLVVAEEVNCCQICVSHNQISIFLPANSLVIGGCIGRWMLTSSYFRAYPLLTFICGRLPTHTGVTVISYSLFIRTSKLFF